jgi:putative flippase GtrA
MDVAKTLFSRLLYSVALPAGIIIACVYVFNSIGDLWFIFATIGAFAIGAFAIYLVFKYWIEPTDEEETPRQQMARFMIIFMVNLGINTEIVYFMVTYLGVTVIVAQTVAAVIIAYESYYAYRSLVFYVHKKETVVDAYKRGADVQLIK